MSLIQLHIHQIEMELFISDSDIITIGEQTGKINVNAIDRDARKNEFYPFDVTFKAISNN